MNRANDNQKQTVDELQRTVAELALRVNQLERILNGLEINESRVEERQLQFRTIRLMFNAGVLRQGWRTVDDLDIVTEPVSLDYVWVGKNRLAVPAQTTNYLKVYLDGTTPPAWVSAMPTTQDENSQVYDVTKAQIHLPGNFG